jgi:class 3 adenylate cyclase
MKFCGQCASPLGRRCPQCGFDNPAGFAFCGQCAAPLTEHPPTPPLQASLSYTPRHLAEKILTSKAALEGERKQVTVLFADMAGFTALAKRLDPEVVHEVMDHCFALLNAEVYRFEGTINQYTGDGIMALFGAPIAHEDSPRRAVHAALGMQRAIRDFGREFHAQRGFRMHMRIEMNTGLVAVGKIGDDLRMNYTAVGDTTNLAARLQQLAPSGMVVISEATHTLVAGFFETRDLGEHAVKGYTEPVRVYEVLRARAAHPPGGGGRAWPDAACRARSGAGGAAGPLPVGASGPRTGGVHHGRGVHWQIAPRARVPARLSRRRSDGHLAGGPVSVLRAGDPLPARRRPTAGQLWH